MPRTYEVVYIFDSALEEAQIDERLERFHALLKNAESPEPVTAVAHWGKRTLAYPIQSKETGHYVVVQFETEPNLLPEFERLLKLDETLLRHLIVVNDGLSPEPAAVQASQDQDGDDGADGNDQGDDRA